jgi:AcrR family transcriptional regulator
MTPEVTATRPHRARRGEGEQLRADVMNAAEELLLAKGSKDAVSIRAIAERVGVTPPSIYLHFADKDELFFEVCDRRFTEFSMSVMAVLQEDDGPAEQLLALGRAYVRWGLEHREHYAILFGGGIGVPDAVDPAELQGRQMLVVLLGLIQRGIDEGVFAADLDPAATAATMWAVVHGFVDIATVKQEWVPDLDLEAMEEQVLSLALHALAP